MKTTLINIILVAFIFSLNLLAEARDTLFISSENLKAGNFHIAASSHVVLEEILWRFRKMIFA